MLKPTPSPAIYQCSQCSPVSEAAACGPCFTHMVSFTLPALPNLTGIPGFGGTALLPHISWEFCFETSPMTSFSLHSFQLPPGSRGNGQQGRAPH